GRVAAGPREDMRSIAHAGIGPYAGSGRRRRALATTLVLCREHESARARARCGTRPAAAAWPPSTAAAGLRQAGVYDQIVTGHAARLVGCQEQHAARDVVADEPEFQALLIEKLPFQLRRAPQCALPRRIDRSG